MNFFSRLSNTNSCFVFLIFLIRLSSVFFVQTWFVPDEYWQSIEVSHYLTYGYGYLTWEWTQGIRSLLYPLSIAVVYKQLENFNLDSPLLLVFCILKFKFICCSTFCSPFRFMVQEFFKV